MGCVQQKPRQQITKQSTLASFYSQTEVPIITINSKKIFAKSYYKYSPQPELFVLYSIEKNPIFQRRSNKKRQIEIMPNTSQNTNTIDIKE